MYVVAKTTLTTINFYCEMYCSLNKSNSNLLAITSCSFFFVLDRQAYRLPDNDWLLSLLEVSNARVIAKAAVFLRYQNEAASWSNTSNPSTCRWHWYLKRKPIKLLIYLYRPFLISSFWSDLTFYYCSCTNGMFGFKGWNRSETNNVNALNQYANRLRRDNLIPSSPLLVRSYWRGLIENCLSP